MANAIRSGGVMSMTALLEYGERVECLECIPLLEDKLLSSDDAKVREMAAWWLRKRAFGYGPAAEAMRATIVSDSDATRRSRAAEALGEFLDAGGVPALAQAAGTDKDATVRASAVRALGRLNAREGRAALASALEDDEAAVRRTAIDQVQRVNHWSDTDALIARLSDSDALVRTRAAQLLGDLRVASAAAPLIELLGRTDDPPVARQAAAIALGRIGGSDASDALRSARERESDPSVQDALAVALNM
jgi:HEAT repeat protein